MSLRIIKAGLFDTVQDGGRHGFQHLGINPSGAMDRFSAQLANALLGKELHAPVLECSFPASTILFETDTIVCITGMETSPTINGQQIPLNHPAYIPANSLLEWKHSEKGRWNYLSLVHELVLEDWLGSYSTNTKIGAGGNKGRILTKGDQLFYKKVLCFNNEYSTEIKLLGWTAGWVKGNKEMPISILKGAEWHWLSEQGKLALHKNDFVISRHSDRMGYRLLGHPLLLSNNNSLVSSAVCAGTIQLLPNGQLIVLMADHQTTGGYPRIGYITSADLSHLAQYQPGSIIQFREVDLAEAEQKKVALQKYLQQIKNACTFKMQNVVHASL
jgi:antagonist of KipI